MASFCRVVFALVEGGEGALPVGRLIPVPSERWTSSRDSLLKTGEQNE